MRLRFMHEALFRVALIASLSIASHAGEPSGVLPDAAAATPQGRAAEARWEKFAAQNARSGDMRLQLLFGRSTITLEQFVERARGSTDPLVLSILSERCDAPMSTNKKSETAPATTSTDCDGVELARRWVAVDTENQLAWLTLATLLDRRGALDEARSTFMRAARASSYRTLYGEAARTILRIVPRDLNPSERLSFAYGIVRVQSAVPFPTFQPLIRTCKLTEMRDACMRIADIMFRDCESLIELFTATELSGRLGVERETARYRIERFYALRWLMRQGIAPDEPSIDDAATIDRFVGDLEKRASLGELAWFRDLLRQRGVSEAEAAARYEKSITAEQRLQLEAVMKPWNAGVP